MKTEDKTNKKINHYSIWNTLLGGKYSSENTNYYFKQRPQQ